MQPGCARGVLGAGQTEQSRALCHRIRRLPPLLPGVDSRYDYTASSHRDALPGIDERNLHAGKIM
jgi:hypothetical protein